MYQESSVLSGLVRPTCIIGIAKAAVFPLPVSAQPKRSRPERAMGMAWAWMGVGLVYEWKVMSFMMLEFSPCASNQTFTSGGAFHMSRFSPTRKTSQCDVFHTVKVKFLYTGLLLKKLNGTREIPGARSQHTVGSISERDATYCFSTHDSLG